MLPQLKTLGRVERGYIGVTLRDVDPDVQASLKLARGDGALVQDVTAGLARRARRPAALRRDRRRSTASRCGRTTA